MKIFLVNGKGKRTAHGWLFARASRRVKRNGGKLVSDERRNSIMCVCEREIVTNLLFLNHSNGNGMGSRKGGSKAWDLRGSEWMCTWV